MPEPDLAARGWDLSSSPDYCWLDHAELVPGYRKVIDDGHRRWEIILCVPDALVLECNAEDNGDIDYTGALTPADSRAGEWPWQPVQVAAAS